MARSKKDVGDAYYSPFAVALRELMKKNGTTQEEIAKITNKTRQTVSQYVNGISEPSYDTLVKIADYFDVSIDFLLGRTKDPRLSRSAVDELGLSEKAISWLEWLKFQGECDPNYKKNINSIFEDKLFQKAFFNMVNYILALDVETLSFQSYIQKMEYGPGREAEAWQAYADEILLLSEDPTFSDRQRELLKAEYERFTLNAEALWAVLSGDDAGFHFSKMYAYRANTYFASFLTKCETEAQKQRDEYYTHVVNSLDSEE